MLNRALLLRARGEAEEDFEREGEEVGEENLLLLLFSFFCGVVGVVGGIISEEGEGEREGERGSFLVMASGRHTFGELNFKLLASCF